jgi:hypothetical protein
MKIIAFSLCSAFGLGTGVLFAADDPPPSDSTTRVVEERKVIEIRRTYETQLNTQAQRKTAIIVENRAGKHLNDKVQVLEDLLAARISGEGFTVLSRDVVTRSLKDYGPTSTGEATALDKELESSTSALRLAQNLGADFLLVPAITSYGSEKRTYRGNDVTTVNTVHTLRVTCKIVEAGEGGSIRGAAVVATKTIRSSDGLQIESNDVINELLDDAAGQIAAELAKSVKGPNSIPAAVAQPTLVNFSISCSMTDINNQPVTVPAIQITEDNKVIKKNTPLEVHVLDVTVELDGVTIGSAPGTFQARPGLHKLRLSREGFNPWERTINVTDGLKLRVALQMSEQGYNRWKDNVAFLQRLENGRKLTDAEVKLLEGLAKFFSESRFRVDTKENIRLYKSIY